MDDVPARLDFDNAEEHLFEVDAAGAGTRLDLFLARRLEELSRAAIQRLIRREAVRLNGTPARASARLHAGDRIEVEVPVVLPPRVDPEPIPLHVLREDEHLVALDKPSGLAVHPGRGRASGTLANAIAYHYGMVSLQGGAYRPGIVHRLDLETSGVMVVAKSEAAHARLAQAFAERRVRKLYRALVLGDPPHDEDEIDLPLGRDLRDPTRMAVRFDSGRAALTRTLVLERFGSTAADLECRPETGRTHQIRVHLLARGHPILGDPVYARGRRQPVAAPRLMLHAWRLAFPHPITGDPVEVEAELPPDFLAVRQALRAP